jgi:TRAP-type transport system periplasmic protein
MGRTKLFRRLALVAGVAMIATACGNGEDPVAEEPAEADAPAEDPDDETEEAAAPDEVEGDDVTLTLGHPFPATHPIQVGAIEPFIEEVAEVTGGTVTIEIVPGGALGPGDGVYENVVAGAQDLGWALHGYTAGRFPVTNVVELPFKFESATQATEVLWTLYEEFPEFQAEYDDTVVLGMWTHDVGDLFVSGDAVESVDDISGLTLRAPGPVQNALISQLGGSAVGMPAPELYDALERGVIDGLMIAASGLASFNLFEVLDAGIQCNCYVASQFLVANEASWSQLSESQQAAIDTVARQHMSMRAAEVYDVQYDEVVNRLEDEGVEYIIPDDDEVARWQEAGEAVIADWIASAEEAGAPGQAMYDRLLELTGN